MPKNTKAAGASYDGLTDVSPADVTEPVWAPAPPVEDKPQPKPAPRRRGGKK